MLNKDINNRHANVGKGLSGGNSPTGRTTGSQGMLRAEEMVFPREEHNWLSNTYVLLNITCPIHIMLLAFMFSGLAIWHWTTHSCVLF